MNRYRVQWIIDMEGDDPEHAVQQAREIQLDPQSIATVFEVWDDKGNFVKQVDLNPEHA